LEELVLINAQWLRQVVRLHGMNTVQTMINGLNRSHSTTVVVGTRCLRARPDEVFERSQLLEGSLACNAVGFISVPSLLQAQRENGQVREILQLLK
jgi:hypothetical protein